MIVCVYHSILTRFHLYPLQPKKNHLQFNTDVYADIVSIRLEQNNHNIICNICISALLFASPIFIRTTVKKAFILSEVPSMRLRDKRLNTVISKTHGQFMAIIYFIHAQMPRSYERRTKSTSKRHAVFL